MSRFQTLADELNDDPLGRGYSGMTDAQAAADINTKYRDVNYPIDVDQLNLAIRESFKWTNYREKADLQTVEGTYDNQYMREFMDIFLTVSTSTPIDLQSAYMTQVINGMESEASMGPAAAAQLRVYGEQTVSRGTELEIGIVSEGDVQYARSL